MSCNCSHNHCHEHSNVHSHSHGHTHEHGEEKLDIKLITATVILSGIAIFAPLNGNMENIRLILFLIAYLIAGVDVIKESLHNILEGEIFDENFLMTVASLGAFLIGEYEEAVAVMLLYRIGEALQSYAIGKSKKSISGLMNIRPDYANIKNEDGEIIKVNPSTVKVGDIIVVKPGERIPLDGIVVSGSGSVDFSALTGESVPVEAAKNNRVLSGCINLNGLLEIRVDKDFFESTASKIIEMVESATEKKAKTENFITKFAKIYTPIVVFSAVLIAVVLFLAGVDVNDSVYRALTFLVVSCPCALVISVPLSFFAGIGRASQKGILIKGSNYMDVLSKTTTVAFDKTGTLTEGKFKVAEIFPEEGISKEDILKWAVCAEWFSNHPIAISLKEELQNLSSNAFFEINGQEKNITIEEIAGRGILAAVNDNEILTGNYKLMKQYNIEADLKNDFRTTIYVALNNRFLGTIIIADEEKSGIKESLLNLKKIGVKNLVMLTGDGEQIAGNVAKKIGIDNYYAELLPSDKVKHIEKLIDGKGYLAFVGDGINDAPVLARADVGIAMGGIGQEAAIEAADVVIMDDNINGVGEAIRISKKTINIAKQNIVMAISIKVLILIFAGFGFANMWSAVFADVGVCLLAVLNSLRTLKIK